MVVIVFKVIHQPGRLSLHHRCVRSSLEFLHRVESLLVVRTRTEDLLVVKVVQHDLERFALVLKPLFGWTFRIPDRLVVVVVIRGSMVRRDDSLLPVVHDVGTFPLPLWLLLDDHVLGVILVEVFVLVVVVLDDDSFLLLFRVTVVVSRD